MTDTLPTFPAILEHWPLSGGPAPVVLICEHASNALPLGVPALGGDLGLSEETHHSHAAWDIGALGLSRALAPLLAQACGGVMLAHAPLSRLVFDLNRPADHPQAMPAQSEIHAIPGNRALSAQNRRDRVRCIRQPFHDTLAGAITESVVQGVRPTLIAVHSFTPVFNGQPRAVEFGILFDSDTALADALLRASDGCGLTTCLNQPYSAQGDVAHTIRQQADPLRLRNTMLEIRNDLIATPAQQTAMAQRLAPILIAALRDQALIPERP